MKDREICPFLFVLSKIDFKKMIRTTEQLRENLKCFLDKIMKKIDKMKNKEYNELYYKLLQNKKH